MKVSDHIIKYRILLGQIIGEPVAQLPPRLNALLSFDLSLTARQELEHFTLILLDVVSAHLGGHVTRDFFIVVHAVTRSHSGYFCMS